MGRRLTLLGLLVSSTAIARPPSLTVAAAGDLQLGPTSSRAQLRPLGGLLNGDLRFANLEGPLTDRGAPSGLDDRGRPRPGAVIRFAAPTAKAALLRRRLDLVSLANNHAADQGAGALEETARALALQGIAVAQAGSPTVLRRRGLPIAVVAADLAEPCPEEEAARLVAEVSQARERGAVIVSLHWGRAGSLIPSPSQRALAARLVDAGARVILGHGPHSPQGVERRGGAVIAYSLGNLALTCRCSEAQDAYVLRLRLDGAGVRAVSLVPIVAGLGGQPPRRSRERELGALLADLSRALGSRATIRGQVVEID